MSCPNCHKTPACRIYQAWEAELSSMPAKVYRAIQNSATRVWNDEGMISFEIPSNKEPWLHRKLAPLLAVA